MTTPEVKACRRLARGSVPLCYARAPRFLGTAGLSAKGSRQAPALGTSGRLGMWH